MDLQSHARFEVALAESDPRRIAAKSRDRRQQPAPMADRRDAEFLDVVGRQVAQHLYIDRVLPERLLVLLQSEAAQPFGYIHDAPRFTPTR